MKYLYNVQMQKADGSPWQKQILVADATGVVAINYAVLQAGEGAVLQNCFKVGQVDHDLTV